MKRKESIFKDNKPLSEVIAEGVLFALGTSIALTIIAGILTAFINLIH